MTRLRALPASRSPGRPQCPRIALVNHQIRLGQGCSSGPLIAMALPARPDTSLQIVEPDSGFGFEVAHRPVVASRAPVQCRDLLGAQGEHPNQRSGQDPRSSTPSQRAHHENPTLLVIS